MARVGPITPALQDDLKEDRVADPSVSAPARPGALPPRGMLAILCAAQFVLILDVAVVNVALVPIARDLAADPEELQLVASVYAATFGGGLLLGGRIADGGRRRGAFLAGLLVFAVASALCGLAWSEPALIAGRALQGLGAALASPAALSLLTTTFREGAQRDRALGVWASVAAAGGAAGLLLGGLLTDAFGWRTVFAVNIPIIAVVVVATLRVVPADRRSPDAPLLPIGSGVSVGATVVLLVAGLGLIEGGQPIGAAVAVLGAAALVFGLHRFLDGRAASPLVPRDLLRSRSVLAANGVMVAMSAVVLGVNFFLAVHLQDRLGFGPVLTGLAFLPITLVSAVTATLAARVVGRSGSRTLLVAGMAAMALGCLLLARLPADGGYLLEVLPGMVLVAAGMGPGFAVGAIAATNGVVAVQQGAAAALLSTATQVGAAVGLAVLGVLAASTSDAASGTRIAFVAMTVASVLALLSALALPRVQHPPSAAQGHPQQILAQAAGCLPGCADAVTAQRRRPSAVPAAST